MTPSDPISSSGLPKTEADWGTHFEAFVADLRAHADDPGEEGDTCRLLLADDREELRGSWELGILLQRGSPPPTFVPSLIAVLIAAAVLVTVVVMWAVP